QGNFDYGCDPAGVLHPQNKVFVYRITMTSPDGHVTELQWNQVKERSIQLGVEHVPEIFYGDADITFIPDSAGIMFDVSLLPDGITIEQAFEQYKQTGLFTVKVPGTDEVVLKTPPNLGGTIEKWREDYLTYLQMKYVYDQD